MPLAAANGRTRLTIQKNSPSCFRGGEQRIYPIRDDGESIAYREEHYATTVIRQTWRDGELDLYLDAPTGTVGDPAQRMFLFICITSVRA